MQVISNIIVLALMITVTKMEILLFLEKRGKRRYLLFDGRGNNVKLMALISSFKCLKEFISAD